MTGLSLAPLDEPTPRVPSDRATEPANFVQADAHDPVTETRAPQSSLTQLATVELGVPIVDAGITTATACVAVVPVVVLFLLLQRQYTSGIIGGSIK